MVGLGPVEAAEFDATVATHRGTDRPEVVRQSSSPADYGVLRIGDVRLAISTGPVLALPGLGLERAGRLAVERLLTGVAASGLAPAHLAVELSLPPAIHDNDLAAFWNGIDAVATEHDVAIATGHTARYEGCAYPVVGAGTVFAVGRADALVGPAGAQLGDRVVVANGPAIAATGILAHHAADHLAPEVAATGRERLADTGVVGAARRVGGNHVTAMAAAGDGGVDRCLQELAEASGVGIAVRRDRFPCRPGVAAVCDALGIDRWAASATGALIVTVAPEHVEAVLSRFQTTGVPAAEVGRVVRGSGLTVDGSPAPARPDPLWAALRRYGVA